MANTPNLDVTRGTGKKPVLELVPTLLVPGKPQTPKDSSISAPAPALWIPCSPVFLGQPGPYAQQRPPGSMGAVGSSPLARLSSSALREAGSFHWTAVLWI